MRTFIALEIAKNLQAEIVEMQKALRSCYQEGVRWIEPQNLHITLIFIGKTNDSERRLISQELAKLSWEFQPIIFQIEQLEFIPRVKPRILWLKLIPQDIKAKKLYKKACNSLLDMGIRLDFKEPQFHITLARIKKRLPNINPNHFLTAELIKQKIEIEELALLESKLSSAGANYFPLEKFSLR